MAKAVSLEKRYGYPVSFTLVGIVLGCSFNHAAFWWGSIVMVAALMYLLERISMLRWKRRLLPLALFSFAFMGVVLGWFWETLPLDWLGVSSPLLGSLLVLFYWGTTTLVLALFVFAALALFLQFKRVSWWQNALLLALLWTIFEYARTWGFALLTFGENSLWGPHFSVGFLGYTLASHNLLLQLASWGGVYILSFCVVLIGALLYGVLSNIAFRRNPWLVGVLLIGVFYVSSFIPAEFLRGGQSDSSSLTFAVVTTDVPSIYQPSRAVVEDGMVTLNNLVTEAYRDATVDVVVLPEDSRFITRLRARNEFDRVLSAARVTGRESLLIDSSRITGLDGKVRSQIFFYRTDTGATSFSHKAFLVPQGEYTPLLHRSVMRLLGQDALIERFDSDRGYSKEENVTVESFKGAHIGALFCSEILTPVLYRMLSEEYGATILINVASHSLFHGSDSLFNQVLAMARVHAVANDATFIQASNGAPSFVLDRFGTVLARSERGNSVLFQEVGY